MFARTETERAEKQHGVACVWSCVCFSLMYFCASGAPHWSNTEAGLQFVVFLQPILNSNKAKTPKPQFPPTQSYSILHPPKKRLLLLSPAIHLGHIWGGPFLENKQVVKRATWPPPLSAPLWFYTQRNEAAKPFFSHNNLQNINRRQASLEPRCWVDILTFTVVR